MRNLTVSELLRFFENDFRAAWLGVAKIDGAVKDGRGNFMFSGLCTILIELICRSCEGNPTMLESFRNALSAIDSRYFISVPYLKDFRTKKGEWNLPTFGPKGKSEIFAMLFDLMRNGFLHQFQQIRVEMESSTADPVKFFILSVTGAIHGSKLNSISAADRTDHLSGLLENGDTLRLKVRTDVLFQDILRAAQIAKIESGALPHLGRKYAGVSGGDLKAELDRGGIKF